MENVAQWILELDKVRGIPFEGNYGAWLEAKQALSCPYQDGALSRAPAHAQRASFACWHAHQRTHARTHARTQYNYSGAQTINQVALTWMGLERAFCLLVPAPWLLFRSGGPNGVGQTGHATPTLHGSHVQPTLSVVLVYVISTSMLNADAGSLPCCTYHPSSQNRHCQINQKFGCRWSQRTVLMPQVLACGWA